MKTEGNQSVSYKTILVHVDETQRAGERIRLAAAVAMAEGAHLIGTAMTGASRYLLQRHLQTTHEPHLVEHLAFLRQRAERGLQDFEATVERLGLKSFERRLVDDEAGAGICLQARYVDLIVIGQNDPQETTPIVMPDFPQYVVLHSGRPVLLVPHDGRFDNIGARVLIGWDASVAATRTLTTAVPMLRRAQHVDAVVFNDEQLGHESVADDGLEQYLARHGVRVNVLQRHTERDVGAALLALASERNSDLLIMGGYGHARFREIMLGGVTGSVLKAMTVPVLMSH